MGPYPPVVAIEGGESSKEPHREFARFFSSGITVKTQFNNVINHDVQRVRLMIAKFKATSPPWRNNCRCPAIPTYMIGRHT